VRHQTDSQALQLLELQLEVLFRLDARGRMTQLNQAGTTPAPRVFLGRTSQGNLYRTRADLPPALAEELEAIAAEEPVVGDLRTPPLGCGRLRQALEAHDAVTFEYRGPAYLLPGVDSTPPGVVELNEANAALLKPGFPAWLETFQSSRPVSAVIEDDRAVSICCSARSGPAAAEAGVDTLAEYRGRGYGAAVTAHWAQQVQLSGRLALYSTRWENAASLALVKRLGGQLYAEDFHLK
jgi:hypothetical protein